MRDIKIRQTMDKPKALPKHFTPKDAASIQKKKLEQQKKTKEPESRGEVRYATDKTEHGMRNGTLLAADTARRMIKRTREKHRENTQGESAETPPSTPSDLPSEVGGESISRNAAEAVQSESKQTAPTTTKKFTVSRKTNAPKSGAVPTKGDVSPKNPVTSKGASTPQTTVYRAKAAAQRKAQRKLLQNTTQQSKNTAHRLGGIAVQTGKAIGRSATSAVSSIAALGGGAVVFVLLLTVILVAALVASPFGILFSGESQEPGTVPISAAVAQVNFDFDAELQALQTAEDYDTITVTGQAADQVEVLAVFAVKVAGSDTDATDVATIDADRIDRLKAVFWDMTTIEHEVEVIHHPGTEDEEGWTERNLYITHVGIVDGWDEDGNIQIIHCASGYNNVVITGISGFTSVARPDYYATECLMGNSFPGTRYDCLPRCVFCGLP